jgi:serine protease Do
MRTSQRYGIRLLLAGVLAAGLVVTAARAQVNPNDEDILLLQRMGRGVSKIVKATMPAVVFIHVEKVFEVQAPGNWRRQFNDPSDFFGDELMRRFFGHEAPRERRRQFKQEGAGSGFIVSRDGYILTNNHVVGDADKIMVKLHDGREFEAKRIGADPKSEVAVIKIEADELPCVELGQSGELEIGDMVIAIGNPFGLTESVTFGAVSAVGRNNIGIADYENFIQTDAAINPGNSGGPLLNTKGQVVGINTAIYSQSGGSMGIGFAIPIDMAKAIQQQLVASGKVVRGYLGVYIQDITAELAKSFSLRGTQGILVADVEKNSGAEKGGLQQGDVILKLDGKDVTGVAEFRNAVSSNPPGTTLKLTVVRKGEQTELAVTTHALPGEEALTEGVSELAEKIGMRVQVLTEELAERFGYTFDKGVIVSDVEEAGLAAQAGITPGMLVTSVNLQNVASVVEFNKALESSDKTGRVVLRVKDGRHHRYVAFSLK